MTLPLLFAAVLVLNVAGLVTSVATGADGLADAIWIGTPLNAPGLFIAVQALAVLAATRHRAGAAVLALMCALSVTSGVLDGAYAADLAVAERALQVALVATIGVLGVLGARVASRPRAQRGAVVG